MFRWENLTSHLVRMKNSPYYIAPVGDWTHDLPHTVASNMAKVSHDLNHSATEAVFGHFRRSPVTSLLFTNTTGQKWPQTTTTGTTAQRHTTKRTDQQKQTTHSAQNTFLTWLNFFSQISKWRPAISTSSSAHSGWVQFITPLTLVLSTNMYTCASDHELDWLTTTRITEHDYG